MIPAIAGVIGPLGPAEWSVGSVADPAAAGSGSVTFGNVLSGALDSLEQSQATATSAAQALATGHATDPAQAVTAVENAALAMDLASQIRTKLVESVQNVFQTQV
jgi:flagellar hook-basal body complex protein FliE